MQSYNSHFPKQKQLVNRINTIPPKSAISDSPKIIPAPPLPPITQPKKAINSTNQSKSKLKDHDTTES